MFGDKVGLVHGRMPAAEKDAVMAGFAEGSLSVLVATTVVEVGVNVPAATIMVIEHAERFGLAQLHQLRGRVGRGSAASSCVLLYDPPLSEIAQKRLDILRRTDDGFVIAELDLELRGGGDPLGLAQSGFPAYRLADPIAHADLIRVAADDARLILGRTSDPGFERRGPVEVLRALFDWRYDAGRGRSGLSCGGGLPRREPAGGVGLEVSPEQVVAGRLQAVRPAARRPQAFRPRAADPQEAPAARRPRPAGP